MNSWLNGATRRGRNRARRWKTPRSENSLHSIPQLISIISVYNLHTVVSIKKKQSAVLPPPSLDCTELPHAATWYQTSDDGAGSSIRDAGAKRIGDHSHTVIWSELTIHGYQHCWWDGEALITFYKQYKGNNIHLVHALGLWRRVNLSWWVSAVCGWEFKKVNATSTKVDYINTTITYQKLKHRAKYCTDI